MKNKFITSLFAAFAAMVPALSAQTSLPYFSGFDNPLQQSGWQQFRKGDNGTYQWVIANNTPYSPASHLMHDYPVGGTVETNDWYVSPAFNFSSGGKIDSLRAYFTGFSQPGGFYDDTVAVFLLQGSPDPALATSRTLLFDFRDTDYQNDGVWRKFSNISIPPTPGQSYVAFYYKTVISWLDVRFDNLSLSANALVPVADFSVPAGVCKGKAVVFKDESTNSPNSWYWQFAGGTPSVSTVSNPTVVFANAGTFTVNLVASNGMGGNAVTKSVVVSTCAGLGNGEGLPELQVYPNPVRSILNLDLWSALPARLRLSDLSGRLLVEHDTDGLNSATLDVGTLAPGIYMLSVLQSGQSRSVKIVKE